MNQACKDGKLFEPPFSIREACLQASSFLEEQLVQEPRANAELLLMHVLKMDKAALLRDYAEPFPEERLAEWERLIRRKAAGEPVQYLLGEQWFYGRPFHVTPAVLIPRPETELLVEAVLEEADAIWPADSTPAESENPAVPTVVDVGTGSGAIAVTLACERPAWRVCASDISADALAVASHNAAALGAAERLTFVQGDLLEPFLNGQEANQTATDMSIDVLVSNPPYIPAGDLPHLQREVRDFEPRLALDGGDDGLDPYRRMVSQFSRLSRLPRIVAFELGIYQSRDVAALLKAQGYWDRIRIVTDYGGIERHVLAIRT